MPELTREEVMKCFAAAMAKVAGGEEMVLVFASEVTAALRAKMAAPSP